VLGAGAGLIFKGTGFYLTDYKKGSEKAETKSKKKEEKTSEAPNTTSTDSKSEAPKTPEGGSTPPKKD
jgi:predicted nucleic acid-binding Zn ribbon protein